LTNEKLEDRDDPKLEQDSGQLARDKTRQVAGSTSASFYDERQDTLGDRDAEASEEVARASQKIGELVAEKYKILGLLGLGGMSAVFKAEHILTNKIVALKLMHGKLLNDASSMRRFQQEARAASRLTHPNAVAVHDMGLEDAQPYLVMDCLEGKALSTVIRQEGKIDLERAINIFIQACSALDEAHRLGIIHRDLKPSNIMLVEEQGQQDFVKLVDFGIAKILSQEGSAQKLTTTGEVFGSPMYMSPEQCAAKPLDKRSDIYSMGCLMYESVCGQPPFEGENVITTLFMQLNEPAPPLKNVAGDPSVVAGLNRIIQKALAKDPSQRYQSIGQVRDDLVELQKLCGTKISPFVRLKMGVASFKPGLSLPPGLRTPAGLSGLAVGLLCLGIAATLLSPDYGLWKDPSERERAILPVPITAPNWDALPSRVNKDYRKIAREEGLLNFAKVTVSTRNPNDVAEIVNADEKLAKLARADGDLIESANDSHEALNRLTGIHQERSLQAADLLINEAECYLYSKKIADLKRADESIPEKAISILSDLEQQDGATALRAQACYAEFLGATASESLELSQYLTVAHLWSEIDRDRGLYGRENPLELTYHIANTGIQLARLHSPLTDPGNHRPDEDRKAAEKILSDSIILLRPLREKIINPTQELAATYDMGALLKADAVWKTYKKDYAGAEADLREAEKCFIQTVNVDDSSVPKVLFDLSDVLWKQKSWWDALQVRAQARQLWSRSHDRVIENVSRMNATGDK
jgi:serine/threonine protein kinase